ncbi:MAG: flagellar biosynthesis protein FlhF [Planctomycetota bacterium]
MTIRTFTANNLADALATVKTTLGSHAVVLHTRTYKRGGVLGLGAKSVVEVTAADGRDIARQRSRQAAKSPRAQKLREAAANLTPATPAETQNAGDLIRRTYQAARAQFDPPATDPVSPPAAPDAAPAPTPVPSAVTVATPPPSPDQQEQMARELRMVKQLVQDMAQQQKTAQTLALTPPPDALPDPLVEHYAALIQQEIAAELANELIRNLDPTDPENLPQALRQQVANLLPTDPDAGEFPPTPDGRPRTIALVGPTGVGKTTTVAKLAATFKLKQNKTVGLITADTYRIAAVEQLRTYANIIGLPLEVVAGPDQLADALQRMSHLDVVLIDTAGRSQRNAQRLDELAQLLEVADPHETHLVLSSTVAQPVLMQTVERFAQVKTDRLIFTKLDEAVACGVLLNVAQKVNKPLSYITTGQEVPHQIEPCRPGRLAELVLGGEVSP